MFACDSTVTAEYGRASSAIRRNCSTIKEVAGVVQLQPIRQRPIDGGQHLFQLPDECAGWRRAIDRPSPEIAERACEGTLGAGEEGGQRPLDVLLVRPALLLDEPTVRGEGIDFRLRWPQAANASIDS